MNWVVLVAFLTCSNAQISHFLGTYEHTVVYGHQQIQRVNDQLTLTLSPWPSNPTSAYGARLQSVHAYVNATFCATILPIQEIVSGAVVSFYVADSSVETRSMDWHEINLGFRARESNVVYSTYFHNGLATGNDYMIIRYL